MRAVGRRVVRALGAAAVGVTAVAGCSSDATSLAQVPPSGSSTPIPAPSALSTSTSRTAATTSTSRGAETSAPVTQVRQPLPTGLAENTKALTDAYFAYWDFATKAYGDPTSGGIVAGVGGVATGAAANQILSDVNSLTSSNQRMVGTMTSTVTSAALSGAAGTVCAKSRDISYPVTAQGAPAVVPMLRDFIFKADLVQSGPIWRVQKVVGVRAC